MTIPATPDAQGGSTRPYLIRALHDWCTDNGFTPYLAVHVDSAVQVPLEYVKNNEIVLNASFEATSGLQLGNDVISFKARFGGSAREIVVPVDHVIAIYARENGQGMAFPAPQTAPPAGMAAIAPSEVMLTPETGPRTALRLASAVTSDTDQVVGDGSLPPDDEPPPTAPEPHARPTLKRVK